MKDVRVIVLLVDAREVGRNIRAISRDHGCLSRDPLEGMKTTDSLKGAMIFHHEEHAKIFLNQNRAYLRHMRPFIVPLDGESAIPSCETVFAN